MPSPHGIAGQFGFKAETTVGTAVVPDIFLPILSEGIAREAGRIESKGIRAGRLVTARWKAGQQLFSGDVEMEMWNLSIALLLKHMFGTIAGAVSPFTFTPGDLTGKSLTMQVGRPDIAGVVQPFTWAGCKIAKWKLTAKVGDVATMGLSIVGMTELTATALAVATYVAGLQPFVFTEASVSIGGTPVATMLDVELSGDNALKERVRLGSATSREYLGSDWRTYEGSTTADFESLVAYNRVVSGAEAAMVLTFANGVETLVTTMNVRFDGDSPALTGADTLEQSLKFKCVSSTSDAAAITAVLTTTEAAPA